MTELTFDMARTLAATWEPGDEVVVTRLDHDANIRPWVIAAAAVGATVRWAEFDPASAELTEDDVAAVLSAAHPAGGGHRGVEPARHPAAGARRSPTSRTPSARWSTSTGCTTPRTPPWTSSALGADFYACSPYKFLGPHCGVLAADPALLETLRPDKLAPSTDAVPERFELGTLPYELLAGTTAAVDFLAAIGNGPGSRRERLLVSMAALEAYEDGLRARIEAGLAELPGITVYSRAAHRTPTLLLGMGGREQEAYAFLAARGVNAPAGSFYALEASRRLGLGDTGALRVGLAPYVDDTDVDRLLEALSAFAAS